MGIWEKTEKRDRVRFLVIAGIAVTLIVAAAVMLNSGRYTALITNADTLSMRSAASVLDENGIKYKINGGSLLVHKNNFDVSNALLMNTEGLGSTLDYSLYSQGSGLTSTDADRRVYERYTLEENLSRILSAYPNVDDATVMLTFPDNSHSLFASEVAEKTAAVTLFLKDEISGLQVATIAEIVGKASGVSPENVAISDQNMRWLNRQLQDDEETVMSQRYAFKRQFETDMERDVQRLLDSRYGSGRFVVTANAKFNYDRTTAESTVFEPVVDEDGIARSLQTIDEYARGRGWPGGEPGTDANGLGEDYDEVIEDYISEYTKTQQTVNYEVNQYNESTVREQGVLVPDETTFAVLIDSNGLEPDDITAQTSAAVRELVGAAIGLPATRYRDNIVVSFMPSQGRVLEQAERDKYDAQLRREQLYELLRILALYLLIAACVIVLIIRTFIFLKPKPIEIPETGMDMFGDYSDLIEAAEASQELEITKTPSRERIEEFINSNPEAVASMIRTWIQDEKERDW